MHISQPPSGGCVLKLNLNVIAVVFYAAATFGWLCVETARISWQRFLKKAAASAQPCVETVITIKLPLLIRAAAYLSRMKEDK